MRAYEDAISRTSTDHAPWYVCRPTGSGSAISSSPTLVGTLKKLKMKYPQPRLRPGDDPHRLMGHTPEALARHPNPLAAHYRRFRVGSGCCSRAIPTRRGPTAVCGAAPGLARRRRVGGRQVDARLRAGRRGPARLRPAAGHPGGDIALGASTHELLLRFLRPAAGASAAAGDHRWRVPHHPPPARPPGGGGDRGGPGARRAGRRCGGAAGRRRRRLHRGARLVGVLRLGRTRRGWGFSPSGAAMGAALLVDAYHSSERDPFSVRAEGLADAYVVGAAATSTASSAKGTASCACPPDAACGRWSPAGSPSSPPWTGARRRRGLRRRGGCASPAPPTILRATSRAAAVFVFFEREGLDPGAAPSGESTSGGPRSRSGSTRWR